MPVRTINELHQTLEQLFIANMRGAVTVIPTRNFLGDVLDTLSVPEEHTEQRVLVDVEASAETQQKLILDRHEGYLTLPVPHQDSAATATFQEYTAPEYLGPRYTRPQIGVATQNSQGNTVTVDVGKWVYAIPTGEAWVVELGSDLATQEWVRRDIDELVPGNGNYRGRFEDDAAAQARIEKQNDFYYNTTTADLRYADSYTPGHISYTFIRLRILNGQDLTHLESLVTGLQTEAAVQAYQQELGAQFDTYDVQTAEGYERVLSDRVATPDSDASNRILWLDVQANIAGSYEPEGDSQSRPYNWNAGDVLVAPPRRDDVIRLFRKAAPGSGLNQGQVDARVAALTAAFVDIEPGYFIRQRQPLPTYHLILNGYLADAFPTVDNFVVRFQGQPVHNETNWTFAAGDRVIDFAPNAAAIDNVVQNLRDATIVTVQIEFRAGNAIVERSPLREIPVIQPTELPGRQWRDLGGPSPYTILTHDTEFAFEILDTDAVTAATNNDHVLIVPRLFLAVDVKEFNVLANRPEADESVNIRLNLNAVGTELTATIRTTSLSQTFTISKVLAR